MHVETAEQLINRVKTRAAAGFSSQSERDNYAEFLQVPYNALRAEIGPALPANVAEVRETHLQAALEAGKTIALAVELVREVLELRRTIRGAVAHG